ncbi:MAG TPA: hypothetical protein PK561_07245 [Fervidobacterium sp.]|nr:hypothetical protein [Fervidobacterium sp.]
MNNIEEVLKAATAIISFLDDILLPFFEHSKDRKRRSQEQDQILQYTLTLRAIQFYQQATILLKEIKELQQSDTLDKKSINALKKKMTELTETMDRASELLGKYD